MNERLIFIGDIQGCREELEQLLEALAFDPACDRLHPVGDLVNRGPDSLGVLRLLRELNAGGVLGNHDLHLLRTAAGLRRRGARDTLDGVLAAEDSADLLAWLSARPFIRRFEGQTCVHAGLNPTWSDPLATLQGIDPLVGDERSDFVTRVRYCTARGERPPSDWPPPPPPYRPWYEHWQGRIAEGETIVYGHWARAGLVWQPGLRGLDTGCVWGGKLSAWIAGEDRLVQVDARRSYAPFDA